MQFKVRHYIKTGKKVCCFKNVGPLHAEADLESAEITHNHGYSTVYAQTDLSPGDIVEIVGDYAVKVSSSAAVGSGNSKINIPVGLPEMLATMSGSEYKALPSSDAIASSPMKQECRCPFAPNLGPIIHVRTCRDYKG